MTKKKEFGQVINLLKLRKKSKKHSGNFENKEESKGFTVI
jgi:hypothetical protein